MNEYTDKAGLTKAMALEYMQRVTERIRNEGNMPIPNISEENIVIKNGYFDFSFDFDQREERLYKNTIIRMGKLYRMITNIPDEPLPKTFTIDLDKNFFKKPIIPKYRESNPIESEEDFVNKNKIYIEKPTNIILDSPSSEIIIKDENNSNGIILG